jgi:hypothetical protein
MNYTNVLNWAVLRAEETMLARLAVERSCRPLSGPLPRLAQLDNSVAKNRISRQNSLIVDEAASFAHGSCPMII